MIIVIKGYFWKMKKINKLLIMNMKLFYNYYQKNNFFL